VSADAPQYWPYYCEENVWHLCADPRVQADDRWVVFVSNAEHRVAMWSQRCARDAEAPVVWDYHVVLLTRRDARWRVWDLDARVGPEVEATAWLHASFQPAVTPPELQPRFRLVGADAFVHQFASDRRHMRRQDGAYHAPAPPWPPIGDGHNLHRFTDMSDDAWLGEILDLDTLRRRIEPPSSTTR
jgi:hypothetical protein